MSGVKHLKDCRAGIEDIRRLNRELEELRQLNGKAPLGPAMDRTAEALRAARMGYVHSLSRVLDKMDGMPETLRSVLWRSYVLGMSNTQIAASLHYARRSVCRLKKKGLAWLEERDAGA